MDESSEATGNHIQKRQRPQDNADLAQQMTQFLDEFDRSAKK
jgi:hypothetical protein